MRIGQLARKHNIPVQEIIAFLEEQTGEKFHPNAKLYDTVESKVFEHFQLSPAITAIEIGEQPENGKEETDQDEIEAPAIEVSPLTPEEEIAEAEGEIAINQAPSVTPEEVDIVEDEPQPNEDEIIQTDKLLEMLESEEAPPNLEKIKLIKAPKKELSGLKVLGKVDLPEPRKKPPTEETEEKNSIKHKNRKPQLSDEEKEKRRLKAKRKKEAFEARQEKRRKEQEAKRLKQLKQSHYKQKLQKIEIKKPKEKIKKTDDPVIQQVKKTKPEPKTWLGKWWRWMNT